MLLTRRLTTVIKVVIKSIIKKGIKIRIKTWTELNKIVIICKTIIKNNQRVAIVIKVKKINRRKNSRKIIKTFKTFEKF